MACQLLHVDMPSFLCLFLVVVFSSSKSIFTNFNICPTCFGHYKVPASAENTHNFSYNTNNFHKVTNNFSDSPSNFTHFPPILGIKNVETPRVRGVSTFVLQRYNIFERNANRLQALTAPKACRFSFLFEMSFLWNELGIITAVQALIPLHPPHYIAGRGNCCRDISARGVLSRACKAVP